MAVKKAQNSKSGIEVKCESPKKLIVETPVPNYCGVIAGVQFAYGKAEIISGCWLETWFREKGYKVSEK